MKNLKKYIKQEKYFLICLFFFSILIRFLVFNFCLSKNRNYWNYDTDLYHEIAKQISSGNGFLNKDGSYSFHRLPGYPVFLAINYKLFGENIKKALWVQIFFASFIPLLIFFLSLILFKENILLAKLSSIFSAIHLGFILYSGLAMSESLFIMFLLIFFILFFISLDFFKNKIIDLYCVQKLFFISSIFCALASMFRPVGHYIYFLVIIILFFTRISLKSKIINIIIFSFGWLLISGIWLVRNFLLTGFFFFHALPGIHFFKHVAAPVISKADNCSYQQALEKLSVKYNFYINLEQKKLGRKLNEIETCLAYEKISYDCFKKNYFLTAKHSFVNIFKTLFSLYSADILYIDSGGKLPLYENSQNVKKLVMRFFNPVVSNKLLVLVIYLEILLYFFMIFGFFGFIIFSFFNKEFLSVSLYVLPFILLFLFISLASGFARLRLPVEPFLVILSIRFWILLFGRKMRVS